MKCFLVIAMMMPSLYRSACSTTADSYCTACYPAATQTGCMTCVNSYNDNGTCKKPTTTIVGCAMYSSATVCSGCNYGFYLDGNTCKALTSNCAIPSLPTSSTCSYCKQNFVIDSSAKCNSGTCSIANCMYCGNGICAMCVSGYSLAANACTTNNNSNCQSFASGICTTCANGYAMSGNFVCTSSSLAAIPTSIQILNFCIALVLGFIL